MSTASTTSSTAVPGNCGTPSHNSLSLRSKVVEILAGTANGCLTELGYFPGMPQKLQELEWQNAQWQSENVKLFQDNRSLTRALRDAEQKETKDKNTMSVLESQVQRLTLEKTQLSKQNGTLMAGHPIAYQQLLSEYQRFQHYYTAALHEVNRLRHEIQVLRGRAPAQQPYAAQAAGGQAISGQSSQVVQSSQSQISRRSSQRPSIVPSASNGPSFVVPSQPPGRQVVGDHALKTQTPFASKMQQALSLVSDWQRLNSIHRSEGPNGSRAGSRASSHSRSLSRPVSSTGTSSRAAVQPSLSVNTAPVPPLQRGSSLLPPTPVSAATVAQRPSVLPATSLEPLNNAQMSSSSLAGALYAPQPLPPALPLAVCTPVQQPQPNTPVISLSAAGPFPQNEELAPQLNPIIESSTSPRAEVLNASHTSVGPPEPIEAITPEDVTPGEASAIPIAPSSTPERESLKRTSSAIFIADEQQPNKRQRVEEPEQADDAVKSPAEAEADAVDVREDEDEGSEDGGVEVGPDGLRLVEDCIAALIDDDEENEELQTCKLCIARFKLGYTTDEPKPFLRATIDQLVQHCATEHHDAWDTLRRDV